MVCKIARSLVTAAGHIAIQKQRVQNIHKLTEPSMIDFPEAWFKLVHLVFSLHRIVREINSAGPIGAGFFHDRSYGVFEC
jgi:hypothetical protein